MNPISILKRRGAFASSRGRERALPYVLAAPTIAVLFALSIYLLAYAVRVSLRAGAGARERCTFENFARLASDGFFLDALWHTLVYAAVALTCEFLLGLALAVLLNRETRGRGLFRAALLVPLML